MGGLCMAEDRLSILDAHQEWQPCELYHLHSHYLVAERRIVNGVNIVFTALC